MVFFNLTTPSLIKALSLQKPTAEWVFSDTVMVSMLSNSSFSWYPRQLVTTCRWIRGRAS